MRQIVLVEVRAILLELCIASSFWDVAVDRCVALARNASIVSIDPQTAQDSVAAGRPVAIARHRFAVTGP